MKEIRLILLILTLGIFSSGCEKEDAKPDLPPPGSMVLEIDNIWKETPLSVKTPDLQTKSNFLYAAASVSLWNIVLTMQMAVPVAAFLESFNHEAVWDSETSSWAWSYSVDIQSGSYTAELFAKTESDGIDWTMYLSKSNEFSDFVWFIGTSSLDNKSGNWIINKDPTENIKDDEILSVPFIEIEWSVSDDDIANISYTNVEPGSSENGSYIKYGVTDSQDFNAFYKIFRVWEESEVVIEWNTSVYNGRVLSMPHFKDPYWHCWNEYFINDSCD